MIRALRPTDVFAYVSFRDQVSRDRGGWGDQLVRSVPPAADLLVRALGLESGLESWIQIDQGRISGLVSARHRPGADVWDVVQLALLPADDPRRTCTRLLERLVSAAGDQGIQKVFLRLAAEDPASDWARQVGFFRYCYETSYELPEVPKLVHPPVVEHLRARRAVDHQGLFQLYSAAVPIRVRQAEAMTLHEWRWTDGWGFRVPGLQPILNVARSDFVVDRSPRLEGWLQVRHRERSLVVLVGHPEETDQHELVRFGLHRLSAGLGARIPVRDYQHGLGNALENLGFIRAGSFALMARAIAVRIPEAKLVPIRAS